MSFCLHIKTSDNVPAEKYEIAQFPVLYTDDMHCTKETVTKRFVEEIVGAGHKKKKKY